MKIQIPSLRDPASSPYQCHITYSILHNLLKLPQVNVHSKCHCKIHYAGTCTSIHFECVNQNKILERGRRNLHVFCFKVVCAIPRDVALFVMVCSWTFDKCCSLLQIRIDFGPPNKLASSDYPNMSCAVSLQLFCHKLEDK